MIAEAFSFPEINSILRWKDLFSTFNKIALIAVAAAVIGSVIFILAGRKNPLEAPKGVRNLAETSVEFIENGIVMQTMGKDGLGWTPFLLSLFIFIYLCNVPGIIPFLQMPATARMAIPMFLALLVWVIYNGVSSAGKAICCSTGKISSAIINPIAKPIIKPVSKNQGLLFFVSIVVACFPLPVNSRVNSFDQSLHFSQVFWLVANPLGIVNRIHQQGIRIFGLYLRQFVERQQ